MPIAHTDITSFIHAFQQQDAHDQPAGTSEQRVPEVRVAARSDPDTEQKSLARRRHGRGRRVRWPREERAAWEQQREEERRRETERRLEAQRQEFERKREARRKAEEAAARTQTQARENSDEGKTRRRKREARWIQGGRQTSGRTEVKADDQKAANETSVAHLKHDTGAASPTTINEECSESHLMAQVSVPTFSLAQRSCID